ncbi:alpha-L-fucosidase [Bryocella elongata]|uniref:alpha-L-fucosidase n=1 Tax=Bryocella elongata TaxID=863522 RepID=A0A1H5VTY3_9BACT|nr:alpha-L-fucosidase [Bryocella elongata]SEF90017.1 alpha-L-fucosidase [Bryocella elongata]
MHNLRLVLATVLLAAGSSSAFAQLEGAAVETGPVHHPVPAIQDTETPAQRAERMRWWREARFGMFIHWGLYAVPAGRWQGKQVPGNAEWIMNGASIPVADYKALAPRFDPVGFNAHDIVALARSAGMKYIIVTAKHHDGFAMFDSAADPFNVVAATPFDRDPLRELAEECRRQGIKLGFYYSQDQDYTAPGGGAYKTGDHQPPSYHWDKAQDGDFATYVHKKAIPQLRELLTHYGEFPAVIWFDTPKDMTPDLAGEIVALLNQHPNLIWNNRLGGTYEGDIRTPEQYIPPKGFPGEDWESCMTINDSWGFRADDHNFKSTETLLRSLIDAASKGGNYLLNIGPDAQGDVPPEEMQRLREIGTWMSVNGEAIYGTTATLFGPEAGSFRSNETDHDGKPKFAPAWNWRSTTSAHKIYIELLTWPGVTFHLEHVPRRVSGAYLLADPKHTPLTIVRSSEGIDIALPPKPPDPIATVLVLDTTGTGAMCCVKGAVAGADDAWRRRVPRP